MLSLCGALHMVGKKKVSIIFDKPQISLMTYIDDFFISHRSQYDDLIHLGQSVDITDCNFAICITLI